MSGSYENTTTSGLRPQLVGHRLFLLLACCSLLVGQGATARAQDPPPAESARFRELVLSLAAEDFKVRLRSEEELLKIAPDHIPEVTLAALEFPGEASVRLLSILEVTFQKHDDEIGDRVEKALMQLAAHGGPVGERASSILLENARIREGRARKAIQKLGGQVLYMSPYDRSSIYTAALAAGTGVGYGEEGVVHSIWLYESWTGGREGLWHLGRFSHVPHLMIYTSPENGLSAFDIQVSVGARFGVSVEVRGGCLGISAQRDTYGKLVVNKVLERTAADAADLREGDVITELNGRQIRSFDELVESLKGSRAGDMIRLKYERGGTSAPRIFNLPQNNGGRFPLPQNGSSEPEEFDRTVRLGSWRESQLGGGYISPPTIFRGPFGPPLGDDVPPPPPLPEKSFEEGPRGLQIL